MYFNVLIFCIGFNVLATQIINHQYKASQDDADSLRWPNLNIVMHVPSENGSLKRVPLYQDPSTVRRNQAVQKEYQRTMGGRYYSNHINNTPVPPAPPQETEWAMGRPPGVRFERPPGINYMNFVPGANFDESPGASRNKSNPIPASRFRANRRNKNLTMSMDVDIHPPPEEIVLENISKDNESTIAYNFKESNQNTERQKAQRRARNKANNWKMYGTNLRNARQKPEPLIEEYSGNMDDLKRLLNDSIHIVNNDNNINWKQYRGYQPPPPVPINNYNPQLYNRQRIEPRFKGIRNRYFQSYQPARTVPDNERYYFSGPKSTDPPNQSFNYSFGGGGDSTPIFWDGTSPMNISITQRDPQNNTIFSYSFDPNRLIQHNVTNKNDVSQKINYYRPRNRVKEAQEASKIWKSISGQYNDSDNPPPLNQGNLFYGHPAPDESPQLADNSELLGFFPKHSSNIFELPKREDPKPEVNKFRLFYSALADEVIPEQKDMILTGIDQDSAGNYVYQPLESNDRKQALSANNMVLVTPAPPYNDEDALVTDKYILMQLTKPKGQSGATSDFKSKVEPLIITSIYRQFLADIKKNVSRDGITKHKLHFSFKLGPGYFNKELVQPTKYREEHFNYDDEKYDSRQYFHDKKR